MGFLYLLLNLVIIVILNKPGNNASKILLTFVYSSMILGLILLTILAVDIMMTATQLWDEEKRAYVKNTGILGYGTLLHPILSGLTFL